MSALVLHIRKADRMPDNAAWTNRFQVRSASSNRLYTIAQSKSGKWWGCSCPGFIAHRHCKHLTALQLPGHHQPCIVQLGGSRG